MAKLRARNALFTVRHQFVSFPFKGPFFKLKINWEKKGFRHSVRSERGPFSLHSPDTAKHVHPTGGMKEQLHSAAERKSLKKLRLNPRSKRAVKTRREDKEAVMHKRALTLSRRP